jgi:hypothetical protein
MTDIGTSTVPPKINLLCRSGRKSVFTHIISRLLVRSGVRHDRLGPSYHSTKNQPSILVRSKVDDNSFNFRFLGPIWYSVKRTSILYRSTENRLSALFQSKCCHGFHNPFAPRMQAKTSHCSGKDHWFGEFRPCI